jgi:4-nitrophenyl phosphatase
LNAKAFALHCTQEIPLTDITEALRQRIRRARGFIFDMDGTIALGDAASGGHKALPGSIDLLALLRERGIPFRVFTNGTAKPPAVYAAGLRKAGFDVQDSEMMTPSTSAAAWFVAQGIKKVRVLGLGGVQQPLIEAGIEVVGPSEEASGVEAVYTGWFREFTFPDLEAACADIWVGAKLTTASHVPFFATANGRGIGTSFAINAMIRSLTGKQALVLGKPSTKAFHVALENMGLPRNAASEIVVVGDDPALEMRMARSAGAMGIGMTTGLMKRGTVDKLAKNQQPHLLMDDFNLLLREMQA